MILLRGNLTEKEFRAESGHPVKTRVVSLSTVSTPNSHFILNEHFTRRLIQNALWFSGGSKGGEGDSAIAPPSLESFLPRDIHPRTRCLYSRATSQKLLRISGRVLQSVGIHSFVGRSTSRSGTSRRFELDESTVIKKLTNLIPTTIVGLKEPEIKEMVDVLHSKYDTLMTGAGRTQLLNEILVWRTHESE